MGGPPNTPGLPSSCFCQRRRRMRPRTDDENRFSLRKKPTADATTPMRGDFDSDCPSSSPRVRGTWPSLSDRGKMPEPPRARLLDLDRIVAAADVAPLLAWPRLPTMCGDAAAGSTVAATLDGVSTAVPLRALPSPSRARLRRRVPFSQCSGPLCVAVDVGEIAAPATASSARPLSPPLPPPGLLVVVVAGLPGRCPLAGCCVVSPSAGDPSAPLLLPRRWASSVIRPDPPVLLPASSWCGGESAASAAVPVTARTEGLPRARRLPRDDPVNTLMLCFSASTSGSSSCLDTAIGIHTATHSHAYK